MATSSEQPDASEARTALAELDAALAAVGARPLRDVVQQLERASPTAAASPVQFGEPSTPSPLPSSSALPSHAGAASSAAVRTPLMPAASAFAPALVPAAGGALPGRSSISVLNEWTQKHRIAQPVYITTSKQLAPGPNGLFHYAACEIAGQRFEGREGHLRKQNAKEAAAHLALQYVTKL